jgi:hypothetical protein
MTITRLLPRRRLSIIATLAIATAAAVIPSAPASAVIPGCSLMVSGPTGTATMASAGAFVNCTDAVSAINLSLLFFRDGVLVASDLEGSVGGFGASALTVASCVPGLYRASAQATIWFTIASGGGSLTLPREASLYLNCTNPPPTVNNPGNRRSLDGNYESLQMTATGGIAPYTWSATNLPSGLSINSSTGLITGYTTRTGSWPVTVTATSAGNGGSGSTTFNWLVRHDACPHC